MSPVPSTQAKNHNHFCQPKVRADTTAPAGLEGNSWCWECLPLQVPPLPFSNLMCSGIRSLPEGKAQPPSHGFFHELLTSPHTDLSSSNPSSPQGAQPEEPRSASLLQRAKALKSSRNISAAGLSPQLCASLTVYSHEKLLRPSTSSSQSVLVLLHCSFFYFAGFLHGMNRKSLKG